MARRIAVLVVIGQQQQVPCVGAALQPQQAAGQVLPVALRVQRVDGAGNRVLVAQAARIRGPPGLFTSGSTSS